MRRHGVPFTAAEEHPENSAGLGDAAGRWPTRSGGAGRHRDVARPLTVCGVDLRLRQELKLRPELLEACNDRGGLLRVLRSCVFLASD